MYQQPKMKMGWDQYDAQQRALGRTPSYTGKSQFQPYAGTINDPNNQTYRQEQRDYLNRVAGGSDANGKSNNQSSGNAYGSNGASNVYSPQQTRFATNQAVANAYSQASPYTALKELDRPGLSRGAGNQRNILPVQMQARAQAAQAQADIPFSDASTNAGYNLQRQVARENEALGLSGIASGQYMNSLNRQLTTNQQVMSLLTALLGV